MKNRKKIISVLAVLTLMVSTMVLFTGCNQFYKKKLVGVWELKKATYKDGNKFPMDEVPGGKMYAYFTDDGKCGVVGKFTTPVVAIIKIAEANYEFNNPKLTIKVDKESYSGDCAFSGNTLTLKGKIDKDVEVTIELEKVSSPSLEDCKNAKAMPIPNFGG